MNLTNVIHIRELLDSLNVEKPIDTNGSYFNRIDFNHFYLEFFAGERAQCEPQVKFDKLLHYKKIQIAIYKVIKEETHAVLPPNDSRFQNFEWSKYFTYVNGKGQTKPSYMGAMIPIVESIDLIRDIYKISRLKIFF